MGVIHEIEEEIDHSSLAELRAYLGGVSRDGHFNKLHKTFRLSQGDPRLLRLVGRALGRLGSKSWMYQETRRMVWALETTFPIVARPELNTRLEQAAYIRGYFDAEGGVPNKEGARPYIQFTQKSLSDLTDLRDQVSDLGIECGVLHNPSMRVDPNYWRFYVSSTGRMRFISEVGSWHPSKRARLRHTVQF